MSGVQARQLRSRLGPSSIKRQAAAKRVNSVDAIARLPEFQRAVLLREVLGPPRALDPYRRPGR